MKDIKLDILIAIDETKSYTQAAEKLGMTQPAISQNVKAMEDDFGVALFVKKNRKIEVTNAGKIAISYAKKIKNLYERQAADIQGDDLETYSLTIGFPTGQEGSIAAKALLLFAERNPNIKISFISNSISKLYSMLDTFELDFFVGQANKKANRYANLVVDSDSVVLAVSKDSPLARKGIITTEELSKLRLVMLNESSVSRYFVDKTSTALGLTIKPTVTVDSANTMYDLITASSWAALTLRSTVARIDGENQVVYIPVEGLNETIETAIVYPKDFERESILGDIALAYRETKSQI